MDFVSVHPPLIADLNGPDFTAVVQISGVSADGFQLQSSAEIDPKSTGQLKLTLRDQKYRELSADGLTIKIERLDLSHAPSNSESQWILEARLQNAGDLHTVGKLLASLRKSQHIEICATQNVEALRATTSFDEISLLPCTLPELNWESLDTSVNFLGRKFGSPMMITGMTGGVSRGAEINLRLARAAAKHCIPMGVGSQRIALEHPEYAEIFAVKREVPDVFLIANLGVAQLKELGRGGCLRAVEMIEADALAIHVNILQEIVQVEGDRNFADFYSHIENVVRDFPVPVIIKEVGAGVDPISAIRLANIGIRCIDTGGVGGTSWSRIEGLRASAPHAQSLGEVFRDWGIPTAHSIRLIRSTTSAISPKMEVTATGGIRDGLMVAKAVALGASLAGIGLPLFRAALDDENGPTLRLDQFTRELKTAMMCSGAKNISELRLRVMTSESFEKVNANYLKSYRQAFEHSAATNTTSWEQCNS